MVHDVVCRGSSAWPCRGTGLRASAWLEAARRGSARCATPWCCRLTYLSAVVPPATGSAASVQSGVLPICIPDSPPGRSNDSPVYPFSLYRGVSLRSLLSLCRTHSPLTFAHFASPHLVSLSFSLPPLVPFVRLSELSLLVSTAEKAVENCSFPTSRSTGVRPRDDILAAAY